MKELEACEKWHTDEDTCCEHIKRVLVVMDSENVSAGGDVQVAGLRCNECSTFHGF